MPRTTPTPRLPLGDSQAPAAGQACSLTPRPSRPPRTSTRPATYLSAQTPPLTSGGGRPTPARRRTNCQGSARRAERSEPLTVRTTSGTPSVRRNPADPPEGRTRTPCGTTRQSSPARIVSARAGSEPRRIPAPERGHHGTPPGTNGECRPRRLLRPLPAPGPFYEGRLPPPEAVDHRAAPLPLPESPAPGPGEGTHAAPGYLDDSLPHR